MNVLLYNIFCNVSAKGECIISGTIQVRVEDDLRQAVVGNNALTSRIDLNVVLGFKFFHS